MALFNLASTRHSFILFFFLVSPLCNLSVCYWKLSSATANDKMRTAGRDFRTLGLPARAPYFSPCFDWALEVRQMPKRCRRSEARSGDAPLKLRQAGLILLVTISSRSASGVKNRYSDGAHRVNVLKEKIAACPQDCRSIEPCLSRLLRWRHRPISAEVLEGKRRHATPVSDNITPQDNKALSWSPLCIYILNKLPW